MTGDAEADVPGPATVIETIRDRRAVHRFDRARAIPGKLLWRVLDVSSHTASLCNLQPWRFLVLQEERNRRKLRACAFNQPWLEDAPVVVIGLGYHHPHETHLESMLEMQAEAGGHSPARLAELRGRARAAMERRPDLSSWACLWTMAALTVMGLTAESLGLATTFIEELDIPALRRVFGIPDDHSVCGALALGYAMGIEPAMVPFDLDEICHGEHFGQPWTARAD